MSIWNVINLAGGLAMFIFGMNLMSDGLKLVAGSYLKKILEKLTKNRIIAMMVGAGLTALIQSSNAMCVMVVGFVNAGMMQLERSVGILMGAKIGTTITGQLIAFNISEIAPVIAFVGVAITMFSKKPKVKNVGQIIASLGVLFIGLGTMSAAMKPLAGEVWFQSLLQKFSNPIYFHRYYSECIGIRRCFTDVGTQWCYGIPRCISTGILHYARYEYWCECCTGTCFSWWTQRC